MASTSKNHSNGTGDPPLSPEELKTLMQRQDPRERREIRQTYSLLKRHTQDNRTEMCQPGSTGLQETLDQVEQTFKRVTETREAAMDSSVISLISEMAKQQAQALRTDIVTFDPLEFAEKLITLIGGSELSQEERARTRLSRDGWIKLGEAAQPFFRRSPPVHCMLGTFERGPPKKKEPVQRSKQAKDTVDATKGPSKPEELKNFVQSNEEVTTKEVERIYKRLCELFSKLKQQPICYFEFITNPDSFSHTVENMFHTSFLVRDGLAEVYLDDEKLPVIVPAEKTDDSELSRLPRNHIVMSLSMEEWKEIVRTFKIESPLIEPRDYGPRPPKLKPLKPKKGR